VQARFKATSHQVKLRIFFASTVK